MQSLIPFDFQDHLVRAMWRDGEPWFVLADVCKVLDIRNARDAAARLDADEVHTVGNADGIAAPQVQQLNIISESGLYALTFTSRKEEAKRFRKWVTAELLPTLRRTGRYALAPAMQAEPIIAANFDPNALTAAIGAVREARRLKGVGAALHLWARLGLPALEAGTADDLGTALEALLHDRHEITPTELAEALGIARDDFVMRRQMSTRLQQLGWVSVVARRNGRVQRLWRADHAQGASA